MESGGTDYVFDSDNECARLERQAALLSPERLLRLVAPPPAAAILDAGCGSGAASRLIAKRYPDARVTGVDLSPAFAADAARRSTAECLSNRAFETGDIAALRFADASVDLIWTQFVLYFLPRPELALAEFRRLLRPWEHPDPDGRGDGAALFRQTLAAITALPPLPPPARC